MNEGIIGNRITSCQLDFDIMGKQIIGYLVQSSLDDLMHLSEQELALWYREKQHRAFGMDWLAGRLAAKLSIYQWMSLQGIYLPSLSIITIENNKYGVPHIVNDPIQDRYSLSISHSWGRGIAFCTDVFMGIGCDLEVIKKRNDLRRFFLSSTEQIRWNQHYLADQIELIQTIAWAAKEATIKCLYDAKVVSNINVTDVIIYPTANNSSSFGFTYKHFSGEGTWVIQDSQVITLVAIF